MADPISSSFSADEITVIRKTFDGFLQHSPGRSKRLPRAVFMAFSSMFGLLGERLFDFMDRGGKGSITCDDYMIGLALIGRGSWDQKVGALFRMFDLHGQGFVVKEDMAFFISQAPQYD